jgi:NAD-dependent dihydropyrimidine dehydrogenase PreA subunit
MPVRVIIKECVGCEMCVDVCKEGAIKIIDGIAEVDPEKCIEDLLCIDECPTEAIEAE